jgi:hypothetical protein
MSVIYINSYQFPAPAGPTDPYFSNVSLLLHGDGTNGSTNIVDSSPTPKTVTAYGDAQISTAQSKFGGSSIAFDGAGDYLTVPSSAAFEFGTGDFTIEGWWRRTAATIGGILDFGLNYGGIGIYQQLDVDYSPLLIVRVAGTDVITTQNFSANQFVHLALSRSGTSLRLFYAGTQQGSTVSNSTNLVNTFGTVAIGAFVSGGSFYPTTAANLDDLRITKGVARYTSNFTPPTQPFPDF